MRNMLAIALTALILGVALVGCGKGHDWNTVSDDHPNLEAARQQARDSWSEFLSEFKKKRPMDLAVVEVHYQGTEYVTLAVSKVDENEVVGVVDNYPQKVGLQKGEQITVSLGDMSVVSDWAIHKENGDSLGGYVAAERVRLSGRN